MGSLNSSTNTPFAFTFFKHFQFTLQIADTFTIALIGTGAYGNPIHCVQMVSVIQCWQILIILVHRWQNNKHSRVLVANGYHKSGKLHLKYVCCIFRRVIYTFSDHFKVLFEKYFTLYIFIV